MLALACGGCLTVTGTGPEVLRGFVYKQTRTPFTDDLRETPVVVLHFQDRVGETRLIQEPITRLNLSAEWDSRALGDIAREHGMEELHYADLETLSILGVYKEKRIHLYGR